MKYAKDREIAQQVCVLINKMKYKNILDLLKETNIVKSKSEAKRLIEQGGIKVDGQTIYEVGDVGIPEEGVIIQRGKRKFVRVKLI